MLPDREDIIKVGLAVAAQLEIKDKDYGSSWRKYEGQGAFFNLARKWDRMETQAKNRGRDILVLANDGRRDGSRDDLFDFLGYGLLTANWLGEGSDRKVSNFSLMPKNVQDIVDVVEFSDDWDEFGGTGIWIDMVKAWRRIEKSVREHHMDLWATLLSSDNSVDDFEYLMAVSMVVLAITENTKTVPVEVQSVRPRKAKETSESEDTARRNFGWKSTPSGKRAMLRGYIRLRQNATDEQIAAATVGTFITAQDMAAFLRNAVPEVFTEYQETMGRPVDDDVLFERFRKMWSQGQRTTEHPWQNHALKEFLAQDSSFSDHERSLFKDEVANPMAEVNTGK
jgi:hypothetical protein